MSRGEDEQVGPRTVGKMRGEERLMRGRRKMLGRAKGGRSCGGKRKLRVLRDERGRLLDCQRMGKKGRIEGRRRRDDGRGESGKLVKRNGQGRSGRGCYCYGWWEKRPLLLRQMRLRQEQRGYRRTAAKSSSSSLS
jgi:hypothetical protein